MRHTWLIPATAALVAPVAEFAYAIEYLSVDAAQRAAFPDATGFQPVTPGGDALKAVAAAPGWAPKVWQALRDGKALGWLIVDQVIGKSELITYAVALDAKGSVTSVEILDYRESHGGEIRLAGWRKQFVGRTVADPVDLNKDIRNISGATLSCRHVTEGVQRLLKLYQVALLPREHS